MRFNVRCLTDRPETLARTPLMDYVFSRMSRLGVLCKRMEMKSRHAFNFSYLIEKGRAPRLSLLYERRTRDVSRPAPYLGYAARDEGRHL